MPKNHTYPGTPRGFLALPPSAARPDNLFVLENVSLLASVPQASKKLLGQKPLRDPFEILGDPAAAFQANVVGVRGSGPEVKLHTVDSFQKATT